MFWVLLIAAVAIAAVFYAKMNARAARDLKSPDTGSGIVEFGRAFPEEAIRALHSTADGRAIFLRLHDGKAGFMQSRGSHYICHVVHPGKVRVNTSETGKGLIVHFQDFAYLDNTFEFYDADDASEVSLWLLGSFSRKPAMTDSHRDSFAN